MIERPTLKAQIEEVRQVLSERKPRTARDRAAYEYRQARLDAALRTLEWLSAREAEIRAFAALPPADRAIMMSHGPLVTGLAHDLARREQDARNGGLAR